MYGEKIISIFATPIYITSLDRKFSNDELDFINKIKKETLKNESNSTSKDNYILNNEIFKNFKIKLNLIVKDYFKKIISSSNNITPYITQSWLNFTETNQYHQKHTHSNSLVSGVLYINCHEEHDKITFFNDKYNIIKLEKLDWNIWNSESWWVPVKSGDIILFPSSLTHMVETKKGENTRISLAFNTFIKGKIGNELSLTSLNL
jgi:uncharacterized protein (TIGR02466 family)